MHLPLLLAILAHGSSLKAWLQLWPLPQNRLPTPYGTLRLQWITHSIVLAEILNCTELPLLHQLSLPILALAGLYLWRFQRVRLWLPNGEAVLIGNVANLLGISALSHYTCWELLSRL